MPDRHHTPEASPAANATDVVSEPARTIGVCGFGRCGTTMVMQMLHAGGISPVEGSDPRSHEATDPGATWALPTDALAGHSIKLLDHPVRIGLPPHAAAWTFIWMDRDPTQQAISQLKLLIASGVVNRRSQHAMARDVIRLAASIARDRPKMLGTLRRIGPVQVLDYERVLANPARAARTLGHIAPGLDRRAAAAAVHRRDGACLPHLDFELGGAA